MNTLYVTSRLRIRRNVVMHVKRHMKYSKCTINVTVGQEVTPLDQLAECKIPPGFEVIHLAKLLGVSPKEGKKYLKREIGKNIYEGELLAFKKGLLGLASKQVLSPLDGVVDVYDEESGNLRIKFLPKIIKLMSGVYGIVDRVEKETNTVFVRTSADIVYGLMGSGQEREGHLRILGSAGMLTSSKQIAEGMEKEIVVAGGIIFLEGLQKAVNIGISGIITGGINAEEFLAITGGNLSLAKKKWTDIGCTVVVTEGFGSVSIGEDIYSLLTFHQGKFAIIEGNLGRIILPSQDKNSMMYIRRTVLPLGKSGYFEPGSALVPIQVGSKVRIASDPYLGSQGIVISIDRTLTKLPSGLTTYLVLVEGRKGKFRVPYTNLEVLA